MQGPRLSIVIEWENVLLAEVDRSKRMLNQLRRQVRALRQLKAYAGASEEDRFLAKFTEPVEVVVLYNDDEIDRADMEAILDELIPEENPDLYVRIEPATGVHYYELKNIGALRASGNFILFLDSDVVPEDGWLLQLLAPLAAAEVHVVGGDAYIEPDDIVAKAFSLFWFFDPPKLQLNGDGALQRRGHFYANNVVFRAEVLSAHPFPVLKEGQTRGACVQLAQELEAAGIGVYRNSRARVSHPAPNGIGHFFTRAMAQGRDRVFSLGEGFHPKKAFQTYLTDMRVLQRGLRREDVRALHNIQLHEVPAVLAIGMAYLTTRFAGQLLAHARPEYARARFHI